MMKLRNSGDSRHEGSLLCKTPLVYPWVPQCMLGRKTPLRRRMETKAIDIILPHWEGVYIVACVKQFQNEDYL